MAKNWQNKFARNTARFEIRWEQLAFTMKTYFLTEVQNPARPDDPLKMMTMNLSLNTIKAIPSEESNKSPKVMKNGPSGTSKHANFNQAYKSIELRHGTKNCLKNFRALLNLDKNNV